MISIKVSGYVIALEGGLRYSLSRHLFAEANVKAAYANYSRFLIANGTGSQEWFAIHPAVLVGVQVR